MADIDIKCPGCGSLITVSEFADPATLSCHACGQKLTKPEEVVARQKPTIRALRVQDPKTAEDRIKKEEVPATEWRFVTQTTKMRQEQTAAPKRSIQHILGWVLFVLLGLTTGFLRYGTFLTAKQIETMGQYAPVVMIAFHVIIILMAFKHSVFHGILCVLVPGYSLYYIFVASDDFIMRAAVAGCLVGFGQDAWIFFKQEAGDIYSFVTKWIQGGGGDIR